jgi:hypothetical protein
MELKFTEFDNNYEKYWEQEKPKKKKVSFDDILSNMNLVVNKSGVLQYMTSIPESTQDSYQEQYEYTEDFNQSKTQNTISKQMNNPIDPHVKHSYIYNKYFKDYNDANVQQEPEIRVPKTIEEYKKMLLDDKIKQNNERIRISQIKSTKMMFTGSDTMTRNIQASKNNLRMMNFR